MSVCGEWFDLTPHFDADILAHQQRLRYLDYLEHTENHLAVVDVECSMDSGVLLSNVLFISHPK